MNKYTVFSVIMTLNGMLTESHGYCVYNQAGSDFANIHVTVYRNELDLNSAIFIKGGDAAKIAKYSAGAIVLSGPVIAAGAIASTNHVAEHHIPRGQSRCWNWESIQHQLHNKNLKGLWFLIEAHDKKRKRMWNRKLNIRDGIYVCSKEDIAKVTINQSDSRCVDLNLKKF